jgi:hypothetical protein
MRQLLGILILSMIFVGQSAAQVSKYKVIPIGFYNFENLFDTIDQENDDAEFLPSGTRHWDGVKYRDKLTKLDEVVSQIGTDLSPDGLAIIGVAEIENAGVLADFAKQRRVANRNYQYVHYESTDRRGIDVGLLYNPKYFKVQHSSIHPLIIYDEDSTRNYTRDILLVGGLLDGDQIFVLVNHWPSRRSGEAATAHLRNSAADICKAISDSLNQVHPDAKVIVMGDLNDDPTSPSIKEHLGAQKTKKKVKKDGFFNPFEQYYLDGIGTLAYQDAWTIFDNIIISYGWLAPKSGYQFYKSAIFNKPFLIQKTGRYKGYPFRTFDFDLYVGGYSDHLPVCIYVVKKV